MDLLVKSRTSQEIQQRALEWRETLGVSNAQAPDIAWALEAILPRALPSFSLLPVRQQDLGEAHGRTSYDPPAIFVEQHLYKAACEGDPFGRYVLAHELGHLDQHELLPRDRSVQHEYANAPLEMSSEWQADEFAYHFLCPREIVRLHSSYLEVMEFCLVGEAMARRAFKEYVTFENPRAIAPAIQALLDTLRGGQ